MYIYILKVCLEWIDMDDSLDGKMFCFWNDDMWISSHAWIHPSKYKGTNFHFFSSALAFIKLKIRFMSCLSNIAEVPLSSYRKVWRSLCAPFPPKMPLSSPTVLSFKDDHVSWHVSMAWLKVEEYVRALEDDEWVDVWKSKFHLNENLEKGCITMNEMWK